MAILERAAEGDIAAFNVFADRLDGKPAQQLIHAGDPENPVAYHKVENVIVDPKRTEETDS